MSGQGHPMPLRHIGIGIGRLAHWHDGLGEFSRQLGLALAARAEPLREQQGLALHFHLPRHFHGVFGDQVGYLGTHTLQRWWHPRPQRFALWHTLHQHNRLRPPPGTGWRGASLRSVAPLWITRRAAGSGASCCTMSAAT